MTIVGEAFVLVSPDGAGFAKKLQTQLAAAGLGNVGAVAGIAIAAGVVAGLNHIGSEFGKVQRIIRQQTGASEQDVAKLFDSVRKSVEQVPVGLEKAGQAVTLLFKRGVPLGPQLDKLAKQELFLAKITGSEVGPTVEKTTALFAKFNVPLREQTKVLDVLFKAQQRSGKSFEDLLDPLQTGGAALQAFGFNIEKSAALVTQLQIAGVNVQPALAGLRRAFGQIAKEGGDPQRALQSLLEEFRKAPNSAKAARDALALFGSRAGPELVAALRSGKFEFGDLLRIITDGKKGIIETGEATLTLGDRIALLRARIEDSLVPAGLAVRQALVGAFIAVAEPLEQIGTALGHTIQAIAPLALVLAPIGLALKAVVPTLTAFGAGLEGIATLLSALHNPAVLAGTALAVLALEGLAIVQALAAAASAVKAFTLALAGNPYVVAAAAITAVGFAIVGLREHADPAIKIAKQLSDSLIDSQSASTIFRAGIDNATQGLQQFIEAELKANSVKGLDGVLRLTGTTVDQLATAITGSASAWDAFAKATAAALKAQGISGFDFAVITNTLLDQRQAFEATAKAQLDMAVATNVLTEKQAQYVIGLHKNTDGSRNFAAELDDVNRRLHESQAIQNAAAEGTANFGGAIDDLAQSLADNAITEKDAEAALAGLGLVGEEVAVQLEKLKLQATDIAASQDALTLSTIKTSSGYGELARSLATGQTSVAGATLSLEKMKLSAAGAAAEAGNLNSTIQSFIDGAVGQLPDVGSAISEFGQTLKADQDQLASDREKNVALHTKINEALAKSTADTRAKLATIDLKIQQDQAAALGGTATTDALQRDLLKRSQIIGKSGQASTDLAKEIEDSNAAIIASTKKLADDGNVNKFTNNMIANLLKVASFTANLQKLVDEGFGNLAGELAKQGPEAAATLAANLAASPAKAAIASKVADLAKATTDNYRKFLEQNAPELIGVGATQGLAIGKAIADGITAELVHNFPFLRQIGVTSGEEIVGGAKEGAASSNVAEPLIAEARKHLPEFRGLGVEVGTAVGGGAVARLSTVDVGSSLAETLKRHREDFRREGAALGAEGGAGIAEGIRSQFDNVGNAVLAVTQHGVAVAHGAWKVQSPSKVFAEIGAQVGAGLAQGITGSRDRVGTATLALATGVTTRVEEALARVHFALPDESGAAAGRSFGAAVAGGLSASAPDVLSASRLVAGKVSAGVSDAGDDVRPAIAAFSRSAAVDLAGALRLDRVAVRLPDAARAVAGLSEQIRAAVPDVTAAAREVASRATASLGAVKLSPVVTPRADLQPLDASLASISFAPVVTPALDDRVLTAALDNVEVRPVADLSTFTAALRDTAFSATVEPVPDLAAVTAELDRAAFSALVTPRADLSPLSRAVNNARLSPTVAPAVDLSGLVSRIDRASFSPTVHPEVDGRTLAATIDRLAFSPQVTPQVDLEPLRASVQRVSFRPTVTPVADLSVLNAAVKDAATFAPIVTPEADLAPIRVSLATLQIKPSVTPVADLSQVRETLHDFRPVIAPIATTVLAPHIAPIVLPKVAPVTIAAAFGRVAPPLLPPVVPTLDAAEFLAGAGRVYARLTEQGSTAGKQAARNVASGLNAGIVGATGDVRGTLAKVIVFPDQGRAAQAAGARVVEAVAAGVAGSAGNVAAALGVNVRAGVASLGPAVREGLASSAASLSGAGRLLASAVDLAPLSASGAAAGEAAAQGVTEGLKAVPVAVGRLRSELVGGLASTAASVQHAAQAIVPQVDSARFAASGAGAGAALGRGLVSGVESTSVPVAAAFQRVAAPALPDLSGVGLELGRSLGDEARIAVTSSSGAFADAGATLAAGLSSRISAGLAAIDPGPHVADKVVDRLQQAFDHLTDAKSTAGFVTFADGLVNTFQQTFDQVAVDAEQLQNVLDALTDKRSASADKLSTSLLAKLQEQKLLITKFAPIEAPSAVLIAQAAQSIQVPRPEDRADAQQPRDAAPRFSIQQTFNEKIDPLHVAAELAWQLL